MDVRLGIRGPPFLRQPLEHHLGIAVAQLRPCVAARSALGEDVDRGVEPNGDGALIEQLARRGIDIGATAGSNDAHIALDQARDQPPLAVAEIEFAVALEDLGGGEAGRALDLGVAVDEGQAQPAGQAPPDRRLSNPHQPHQHHRAVETLQSVTDPSLFKGLYSGFAARQKPPHVPIDCSHRPRRADHRRTVLSVARAQAAADPHDRGRRPGTWGQCALSSS